MTSSPYYRLSGRVSPIGAMMTLFAVLFAALALGALYGVLVWICPIIYANVVGTLGLGFALGWLAWRVGTSAKVRSAPVVALCGLVGGATAVYAGWVAWIFALSGWEAIILNPTVLAEIIPEIGHEGVWSLRGGSDPVRGAFLFAIWLVEAGAIVGVAAVYPYRSMVAAAFCEPCGKWVTDRTVLGPFAMITDPAGIKRRLEAGEFSALGELRPPPAEATTFTFIDLLRCTGCDDTHLMSLRTHEVSQNRKGEVQQVERQVLRYLIIDQESRDLIVSIGKGAEEQASTPPAQGNADAESMSLVEPTPAADSKPTA